MKPCQVTSLHLRRLRNANRQNVRYSSHSLTQSTSLAGATIIPPWVRQLCRVETGTQDTMLPLRPPAEWHSSHYHDENVLDTLTRDALLQLVKGSQLSSSYCVKHE